MPRVGKTIAHHAITKAIGRDDMGELVDKSRNADLATLALLFLTLLSSACRPDGPMDLSITGVSVVDIEVGEVRSDQTILIHQGRIVSIEGDRLSVTAAAEHLDGRGLYAIPGLWDMHVHALWDWTVAESFLPQFAAAGISGIRDMGGDLEVLERVRAAAEAKPNWPHIVAAGKILDGPKPVNPDESIAVATPEEGVRAVDRLAAAGVDFIKVYTLLPRDAYFAIVKRAREQGLMVAGHIPAQVSPAEAAAAGQASVEHLRDELDPLCSGEPVEDCLALLEIFRQRGTHNTPTLVVLEAKSIPGYHKGPASPLEADLPPVVRSFWHQAAESHLGRPQEYFAGRQSRFRLESALVARLARAKAPLLAGTDTGNPFIHPGRSLQRELELLVEAGLSPQDALRSATLAPAEFLGLEAGLRPGAPADIVLVEGNPLENVSNVGRVSRVILRGRLLNAHADAPERQ